MAAESGTLDISQLRGSRRRRRKESIVYGVLATAAGITLAVSIAIVIALLGEAIVFLKNIDLSQLVASGWFPRRGEFDLITIFAGTMMIAIIAMVIATPLGFAAALYLSEYASPGARRKLKPIIETLAGVPSVVLGYFALTVINPDIVRPLFNTTETFTIMAAGIGVGILTIPLVATVTEDALHAVPNALREAAYGVGAKRRTVATRVVFPAAVSGIVAALILGFSRAVGETMVVAIAAGATGGGLRSFDPLAPGQTMTGAIAALAIGSDQVRGDAEAYNSLYFVGLLLFAITFVLNVFSERFVRRVRKSY